MAVSISDEDFQRLQNSLIDLKNENYNLQEKNRKQAKAVDELTSKSNSLEQELGRANKTIQKSKKAVEVQQLLKENQSLNLKLSTQDEDFRLQNQTLLQELSKLVEQNEKLEARFKTLDNSSGDGIGHVGNNQSDGVPGLTDKELLRLLEAEKKNSSRLNNENSELKEKLKRSTLSKRASDSQEVVDIEVSPSKLGALGSVSFKKTSICEPDDQGEVDETTDGDQTNTVEINIATHCQEENDDKVGGLTQQSSPDSAVVEEWKLRCLTLQSQVTEYQEKLRRKQDSFVQIQREKELQYQELTIKLEEQRVDKDQEIVSLKEQSQRLQGQLNFGHSAYAEFKEKKNAEVQKLEGHIKELENQVNNAPKTSSEVSDHVDTLTQDNDRLKTQCLGLGEERENLSKEVQSLMSKLNAEGQAKEDAETRCKEMEAKLEESVKTSDNRKSLLDDMAVTLQTKSDESNATIARLETQEQETKRILQAKEDELGCAMEELELFKQSTERGEVEVSSLKQSLSELEARMVETTAAHDTTLTEVKESAAEEVKFIKADQEIALRDLQMQLEISNAQRSEFEERSLELAQEVRDVQEERKIGEKKSGALAKDLKRQLLQEKQRNDKLSDKLDKLLAEASANVVIEPRQHGSTLSRHETESEDAKSTGSWSIYSDSPKNHPMTASNNSLSAAVTQGGGSGATTACTTASGASSNFVTSPVSMAADGDLAALLAKIEVLQNDKFGLEQKTSMLEASAAAMADELVRKSEIILHYCMEGKNVNVLKGPSSSSTASAAPLVTSAEDVDRNSNANKLKKVRDMIKNAQEQTAMSLKNSLNNNVTQERDMKQMQRILEETLTKNMHLQKDLENMSQEIVRLSKTGFTIAPPPAEQVSHDED